MIDEQTGQLEDELISKVVSEVRSSPGELSNLLVLPLRVLPQLEHIGREAVASLISLAIELCAQVEARDLWERVLNLVEGW